MSAFASLLHRVCTAASLPLEVLAERCRVSRAAIAAFEQGRRPAPRLPTAALIADSPGLSAADRPRLAEASRHAGSSAELPGRLGGPVAKLDEAPCR